MRTARLLTVSQNALRRGRCLPRGVSAKGISAQGVSAHWGSSRGVSVQGGGVSAQGGGRHPLLWTQWQTGVKTLPCRNFVADGKKAKNMLPL